MFLLREYFGSFNNYEYILVMLWFRMSYCKTSHELLEFSVYTRVFGRVCIQRKSSHGYIRIAKTSKISNTNYFHRYKIVRNSFVHLKQLNTDFSGPQNKRKLVRESSVKMSCLNKKEQRILARVIGSFGKMRVRGIGILL